jgi:hypothetical protein
MSTTSTVFGFRVAVAVLTLGTAVIHLSLAFPDPVFIMNGLGYLALLAALLSPRMARYHVTIRWLLVGYAALTIFLWILFGARSVIGYTDKIIEIALIAVLLLWTRRRNG